jgi:hypothetical protein
MPKEKNRTANRYSTVIQQYSTKQQSTDVLLIFFSGRSTIIGSVCALSSNCSVHDPLD